MADDRASRQATGHTSVRDSLASGRVWLLCAVFFMHTIVNYGIFLWLPKLLQDVTGARGFTLSAMTAFPFVVALAAMVLVGRHSDRSGERRLHVAACAAITAAGLLLAVVSLRSPWLLVVSFTITQVALRSLVGVFWAMPPQLLGGTAAAAGIALINSIGNLGGFFGPTIVGTLHDVTGGYTGGLLVFAAVLVVEALLVLRLKIPNAAAAAAR